MKIAIILLDDLSVEGYGDFGDMGIEYIKKIFLKKNENEKEEINMEFIKFDYIFNNENLPNYKEFNLIYLTGSRKDSYLNDEFNYKLIKYLKNILKDIKNGLKIKLLGICFGHQIIARSLESFKVIKNELGWEIGQYNVGDYIISMSHQDIVVFKNQEEEEEGNLNKFKFLGLSEKCPIQSIILNDNVLTFQGHPEFDLEYTLKISEKYFKNGKISKELHLETIKRSIDIKNDNRLDSIIKNFIMSE